MQGQTLALTGYRGSTKSQRPHQNAVGNGRQANRQQAWAPAMVGCHQRCKQMLRESQRRWWCGIPRDIIEGSVFPTALANHVGPLADRRGVARRHGLVWAVRQCLWSIKGLRLVRSRGSVMGDGVFGHPSWTAGQELKHSAMLNQHSHDVNRINHKSPTASRASRVIVAQDRVAFSTWGSHVG
jgi:hypothetical protein